MFERIIEIILFVMTELKYNADLSKVDVNKLQKLGYSTSEISTAFSWLVDRFEISDDYYGTDYSHSQDSFRVLHEAEEELFTRDARGELIQFKMLGLINNQLIEAMIERAMMMGMPIVDSKLLNTMLVEMLFEPSDNSLNGSRYLLKGNDTIN